MSRLGTPNEAIGDKVVPLEVSVVTIDQYCCNEGLIPDWLLVDIEGFEIAALSGARSLIKESAGRLGIVVEMHPNVWALCGTSREKAESLLAEYGLCPQALTGQGDPLAEHGVVYLARRAPAAHPVGGR